MNSSFQNRWSFCYLKFTKYIPNIIAEPKYKYRQQEQVTVRNHNRSTALKSDFIHFFFMILYMYIAPGQGLTTPWGRNFDFKGNILSIRSFVASFKNITKYIALGQGQTAPMGQSFDVNKKVLSLYPFCKFKKKSL